MTSGVPKYYEFMVPTLLALIDLGGSAAVEEINDRLIDAMRLNPQQLDIRYPTSGALVVPDRMSWARSYLRIAGLLASGGKGIWLLTEAGRNAASLNPSQVKKIVADASKASAAARDAKAAADASHAEAPAYSEEDPTEQPDWRDQLLDTLRFIEPSAFERLCQRLLRASGFVKVEVTGKSGDGGIDGSGVLRMNLISFQVLFQCKRYAGSVAAGTVRDFRGAMQGRADKGLIITTGSFTPDARREATRDGAPAIDLIDGAALCQLLLDLRLGVEVKEVVVQEISVSQGFFESL